MSGRNDRHGLSGERKHAPPAGLSTYVWGCTMNKTGFSLIELIVTMAIIGTLLAIVSLDFHSMQKKSQIESKTREIYNDLNEARLNSIYQKKIHRIVFQPNSYVMKRYSSENEDRTDGGTVLYTKNTSYQLSRVNGGSIADIYYEFDLRGFTAGVTNNTVYVNPVNSGAMFDCVVIHIARTNMGQGVDSDNDGKPNSCNFQ